MRRLSFLSHLILAQVLVFPMMLPALADTSRASAFVDVSVITMEDTGILEHQTVIIERGFIVSIEASDLAKVPPNALVIDGRGRFLLPGLADMHVHAWQEQELTLFVANGITTVRNLFGDPLHLDWRKRIDTGELLGPRLYTSGPIIDGGSPRWPGSAVAISPEQGIAAVMAQKQAGYDSIKVYEGLTEAAYDAILATAQEQELRVAGHVPKEVSIEHVLNSGQDTIEHARHVLLLDASIDVPALDMHRLEHVAALAKKQGAWLVPTLDAYSKVWPLPNEVAVLDSRPERAYLHPEVLVAWQGMKRKPEEVQKERVLDDIRRQAVRFLHESGVRILAGTDTPNPNLVPGFAIHDELEALVLAGMTPYEALRSATRNPAEYLRILDVAGTVAVGKRADLVLLDANPLKDIRATRRLAGVMLRGAWWPRAELQKKLDAIALANQTKPATDKQKD